MPNKHTALLHHFFQMAIAQRIGRVPTEAHQNDVEWEAHPLITSMAFYPRREKVLSIDEQAARPPIRQKQIFQIDVTIWCGQPTISTKASFYT